MEDFNLTELKKICPIDIKDIIDRVEIIENNMLVDYDLAEMKKRSIDSKKEFKIIYKILLSKLHELNIYEEKKDVEVYNKLQNDLGRMIGYLDLVEEETIQKSFPTNPSIEKTNMLNYNAELMAALFGGILYPLKSASEEEPKDQKKFLKSLRRKISVIAGTFGSPMRDVRKGRTNIRTTINEPSTIFKKKTPDSGKEPEEGEDEIEFLEEE